MKAVTWHGKRDVRIDEVPDPVIEEPTDAIIRVTSTAICGSDLHLYEVLGPFLDEGDILGHEPMGIVEEVGSDVTGLAPGDRVVIPFNVACGHCAMCGDGLQSQCETTQVHEHGTGAALLGYTRLYGQVAGGQAEYLRVPQAQYGPIKVPEGPAPAGGPRGGAGRAARGAAVGPAGGGGPGRRRGVWGGARAPLPLPEMFDTQPPPGGGRATVTRWPPALPPLVSAPADPLDVIDLATHHLPLDEAPEAYAMFQEKRDGAVKVVLRP